MKSNPLIAFGGSALLVSLFVVYGALAYQFKAEYAMREDAMQAAANLPVQQTISGPSALCDAGGEVFVYSKDFSNALTNNSARPAAIAKLQCYTNVGSMNAPQFVVNTNPGFPMNLLEQQVLNPAEVCRFLPPANASQCAVVFYAVVPNLDPTQVNAANPNHIPSKHVGQLCGVYKVKGQSIQASECNTAASLISASARHLQTSASVSNKMPIINSLPTPSQLQQATGLYEKYGSPIPVITGQTAQMPTGGVPVPGAALPPPNHMFGVQFKFQLCGFKIC